MATDTKSETVSIPVAPRELWGLWNPHMKGWTQALDEVGNPYLWFESEEDAKAGALYHADAYDCHCVPVNILTLNR